MDVMVRALVVFLCLWLLMRIGGKRQLSELSAFELVTLVVIGDLIGPTVMQETYSLTVGLIAVSVFVLAAHAMAVASRRWPRARDVLEGRATVLVRDGRIDAEALRAEGLGEDELFEAARAQGLADLSDVELGLIEANGRFSFLRQRGLNAGASG